MKKKKKKSSKINQEEIIQTNKDQPIQIMTDGHLGLNIGNGISIDLSDGSIGLNLGAGISFNGF